MKRIGFLLLVFLVFAVASLMLVACETEVDTPADDTPADDTPADDTPADDVDAPEAADQDLIVARVSDSVSMDPQGSNDMPSAVVHHHIYETLVQFDDDLVLQPLLATDWEMVDDVTWEFKLREGIKFVDGTDFKADSVVATFERILDPDIASPRLFLYGMIEEIIAVDDYTVHFVLDEPFAPFPAHLSHGGGSIVSKAAIEKDYEEMAAGNEPSFYLGENAAGTGAFMLEEWVPGEYVKLVRNNDYWGENALLDSVTYKVVPEPLTRISELETGYSHVSDPILPSDLPRVDAMTDAGVYRRNYTTLFYLGFNCEKPPFDDVRVRQALSMTLDKDIIVDNIFEGTAVPAHGPIAPGVFGYDPAATSPPVNMEKAKELLADAGYADGFSSTIWTNDNPIRVQIAEYAQSTWRELGIDIEIEVLEWGAYLENTAAGEHDMFLLGWVTVTLDADYGTYSLFHSDEHGEAGNRSFFSNPRVDELLEKGRTEPDPDARTAVYSELSEILIDEAPMFFVAFTELLLGLSDDVKGFHATATGLHELKDVYLD